MTNRTLTLAYKDDGEVTNMQFDVDGFSVPEVIGMLTIRIAEIQNELIAAKIEGQEVL
jgi:hypothetical protein